MDHLIGSTTWIRLASRIVIERTTNMEDAGSILESDLNVTTRCSITDLDVTFIPPYI